MHTCPLNITMNRDFAAVINACAKTFRPGQNGSWITKDMQTAYIRLHELGHAHSIEAWRNNVLVGGMYGVGLGCAFSGESMFCKETDASKYALIHFAKTFFARGGHFIDCQQQSEHMSRFGARDMPRDEFLKRLKRAVSQTFDYNLFA